MNVLLLIARMDSGGAETHVLSLARGLVERGHSVTVASASGRLTAAVLACGAEHIALPLDKRTPSAVIKSLHGIKALLAKKSYRIVHAHSRMAAFLADAALRHDRGGAVLVTTVHAHFRNDIFLRHTSRWGSRVIAVSDDLRLYLMRCCNSVLADGITVIPNGIACERFVPRDRAEQGRTVIAFLSRLDADCSDVAYALCRLAPYMASRYEGLEIVIGGGGSEYENIKRQAERANGIIGRRTVSAVGHISDTPSFLGAADVFVGVSRAALEAMSCAVPVVLAGNEGFIGVCDGERILEYAERTNFCCRGCEHVSDGALISALTALLDMPFSERKALGNMLRRYVCVGHSAERMTELTERVYEAVTKSGRGKQGALLCGYYGFGNLGDDVLLMRSVQRVGERYGDVSVCALSRRGGRDSAKFGIRCVRRSSPLAVIRELRRSKVVIFGGGSLLQSNTSRRSLRYYLFLLSYAQRLRKRCELWGNGIGHIGNIGDRRATAQVISRCAYVGLRDRESLRRAGELLTENGFSFPHMELEEDMALKAVSADERSAEYILSLLGVESGRRIAVIAVRGTEAREYVDMLVRLVRALAGDGITAVFAVMYPRQDIRLSKRLSRECGGILAYPLGCADTVGLMKKAELVCGMRYHALVFAHVAGTPFIGIGADEKLKSFCRSYGGVYYEIPDKRAGSDRVDTVWAEYGTPTCRGTFYPWLE